MRRKRLKGAYVNIRPRCDVWVNYGMDSGAVVVIRNETKRIVGRRAALLIISVAGQCRVIMIIYSPVGTGIENGRKVIR